jgi:uncharacterized protein
MTDVPKKLSETARTVLTLATTPRGFLKVVDEKALAFADYRGNRQYHQHRQPRGRSPGLPVLMDYPHRARLKAYAHVEADRPAVGE